MPIITGIVQQPVDSASIPIDHALHVSTHRSCVQSVVCWQLRFAIIGCDVELSILGDVLVSVEVGIVVGSVVVDVSERKHLLAQVLRLSALPFLWP